jgi:hypothetical protein
VFHPIGRASTTVVAHTSAWLLRRRLARTEEQAVADRQGDLAEADRLA